MARRTQGNQIFWLVVLWSEVSVMYREGSHRPLGTGEVRVFFSWTQTLYPAMLTTPASCFFGSGGDLIPVIWVALAVDGHEPWLSLELESGVTTPRARMPLQQ